MSTVEVCFSTALFSSEHAKGRQVVVIDVLRASSSMCAALDAGALAIRPALSPQEAFALKRPGSLVAAERDGCKVEPADLGNSPLDFNPQSVRGKEIVFTTTNGTAVIMLAKPAAGIIIGCFNNADRVTGFLSALEMPVILACAGWKGQFSTEDTLCAGAIARKLTDTGKFRVTGDAARAAAALWEMHKNEITDTVLHSDHGQRLLELGLRNDIEFCTRLNTSNSLPVWNGEVLQEPDTTKSS